MHTADDWWFSGTLSREVVSRSVHVPLWSKEESDQICVSAEKELSSDSDTAASVVAESGCVSAASVAAEKNSSSDIVFQNFQSTMSRKELFVGEKQSEVGAPQSPWVEAPSIRTNI